MWRALVLVAACGGGQSPPTFETAPFTMLICTAGLPGDPTCPVNVVALDDLGATDAVVAFTAGLQATGFLIDNFGMSGGSFGVHAENPQFLSGGQEVGQPFADTIEIRPNCLIEIAATTLVVEDTTAELAIRFDVFETLVR